MVTHSQIPVCEIITFMTLIKFYKCLLKVEKKSHFFIFSMYMNTSIAKFKGESSFLVKGDKNMHKNVMEPREC